MNMTVIPLMALTAMSLSKPDRIARRSLFQITVEQTYSSDGNIADVELTTRLEGEPRTYYLFNHGGRTLRECLDESSGTDTVWTESVGRILVSGLPSTLKHQKRQRYEQIASKKELRVISGVECYPVRIDAHSHDLKFVDWVSARAPDEVVASLTFLKGKLIHSIVHVERRTGRPEDLKIFAFPKDLPRVATSRKALLSVCGQFILVPTFDLEG